MRGTHALPVPGVEGVALRGRGRVGEVHEAHDTFLGRRVAVRLLDHGPAGDDRLDALGRRLVPASRHVGVLTVHGIGTTEGGQPFQVGELMVGGDLESWRLASGPLPVLDVLRIAVAVADGLAALHDGGVVHGDVRPANVLLDHRHRAALADAGLAVAWMADRGLARAQVDVGQLALLPPEVLAGGGCSPAGDVWALAATVHTLLGGALPFPGVVDGPDAVAEDVMAGRWVDLRDRGLSPELGTVLAGALEVDPARRTPSAAALAAQLREVVVRAARSGGMATAVLPPGEVGVGISARTDPAAPVPPAPAIAVGTPAAGPAPVSSPAGRPLPDSPEEVGSGPAGGPAIDPAAAVARLAEEAAQQGLASAAPDVVAQAAVEQARDEEARQAELARQAEEAAEAARAEKAAREAEAAAAAAAEAERRAREEAAREAAAEQARLQEEARVREAEAAAAAEAERRAREEAARAAAAEQARLQEEARAQEAARAAAAEQARVDEEARQAELARQADAARREAEEAAEAARAEQARLDEAARREEQARRDREELDATPEAAAPSSLRSGATARIEVPPSLPAPDDDVLPDALPPAATAGGPHRRRVPAWGIAAAMVLLLIALAVPLLGGDEPEPRDMVMSSMPVDVKVQPGLDLDGVGDPPAGDADPDGQAPADAGPVAQIPFDGPDVPPPPGVEVVLGQGLQVQRPATDLLLARSHGLAFGEDGEYFVADGPANRVYRVDADGTVTIHAGSGNAGFDGDGGPAHLASLHDPYGLAVHEGALYITDRRNGRVRRVDADGTISTVAGAASSSPLRAAVPHAIAVADDGTVYVTTRDDGRVLQVTDTAETIIAGSGDTSSSGDGGPALAAGIAFPTGIALDGDDLLVLERGVSRASGQVRRLTPGPDGFSIATVPGSEGLDLPQGIAVDGDGSIVVTDTFANTVVAIADNGRTVLAGRGENTSDGDGGAAEVAAMRRPNGVAVRDGEVLVTEGSTPVVRRIAGGTIDTVVGRVGGASDQPAADLRLTSPNGLAEIPSGGLVVVDQATFEVYEVVDGLARSRTEGTARFDNPVGLAVDEEGAIYVADTDLHVVWRLDKAGVVEVVAGTLGERAPDATAAGLGDGGPATAARLNLPRGIDWHDGTLWIADSGSHRIRAVGPDGVIRTVVGAGGQPGFADGPTAGATPALLNAPFDVDVEGEVMVIADKDNHAVRLVDLAAGSVRTLVGDGQAGGDGGTGPAADVRLSLPVAVAVDAEGRVVVADNGNRRVLGVADGVSSVLLGDPDGPLGQLRPVAVTLVDGEVTVLDLVARRAWSTPFG